MRGLPDDTVESIVYIPNTDRNSCGSFGKMSRAKSLAKNFYVTRDSNSLNRDIETRSRLLAGDTRRFNIEQSKYCDHLLVGHFKIVLKTYARVK
jgi:hypothetical protein